MLRPLAPPARVHAREALPLYGMCTQSCIQDVFRRESHATLCWQGSGVLHCLWPSRVMQVRGTHETAGSRTLREGVPAAVLPRAISSVCGDVYLIK